MNKNSFAVLGVGNILEKDDGIAVYAANFLESNYHFTPDIDIINGGVEGINLLNLLMQYDPILILDTVDLDDAAGSIYHIPASELTGYGLNSAGAHEIGVIQCLDMMELMDKKLPKSSVLGIVPDEICIDIGLSETLHVKFDEYIKAVLFILGNEGIKAEKAEKQLSLEAIIENFKNGGRD